jgi:hypothetical protein
MRHGGDPPRTRRDPRSLAPGGDPGRLKLFTNVGFVDGLSRVEAFPKIINPPTAPGRVT